MSIRLRLTLWSTALLSVVLTILAVLVYLVVADQMANRLDATLIERAADVQPEIPRERGRDDGKEDCSDDDTELVNVELSGASLFLEVHDACGNVALRSSNLAAPLPIDPGVDARVFDEERVFLSEDSEQGRLRILGATTTTERRSSILYVATPLAPLTSDLLQLRLVLIGIVVSTLLLSAIIGWFLAAKAMQPVDRMTRAAHEIGLAADPSGRLPSPPQNDEIGRLANTFNEMLERLQGAFVTQRQFLADASHELRSPLTAIRANVESLRRGAMIDPAEREETMRIVEREVDRMGRLVDDLLGLARADAGQDSIQLSVALDSIFLEVYHQQRALAGRVKLVLGEFEPVELMGDRDRLKQLLLNLVDNALRHTPPGGTVTLDLMRRDASAIMRVSDTGQGIAPEHLPHIFERFYRVDVARSRRIGGTGLGLAICRDIANAHGGKIEVESVVGHGTTFTVELPIEAESTLFAIDSPAAAK